MRFFLPALLLAIITQPCFAQNEEQEQEPTKEEKITGFLTTLKNGFLLVRLQDRSLGLKTLEEKGYEKKAEEVRKEQYNENKETILSFEQTFDYCPVYFFYAKHSEQVREGNLEGIVFDAANRVVETSELQSDFYTAEFSETKNLGIDGLIIMDQNLIPLEAPLPFYERRYTWFGLVSRSKAQMAEAYDSELDFLYDKYVD